MTLTEAVFGVCGQWLCEFIEATPRTGEVTMNQSGSLRASGWLQRWRCLLMLRIRGPKFQAGLMKVLTLMSTLLMNILESRSFREQAESVLNGPGNGGGSLVLLRLDLMKSLATQVGLGSACGQMWPVWTIWGQHLSCSLCPRVKTNTCFMCCCDGCGERAEECGPVTPSLPLLTPLPSNHHHHHGFFLTFSQCCPNEYHLRACSQPTPALSVGLYMWCHHILSIRWCNPASTVYTGATSYPFTACSRCNRL